MNPPVNFVAVASAALRSAEPICRRVLPGGRVAGAEYVALNPLRADTRAGSLKVNLHTGRWADFATGERGGDLISLVAWRYGVRQIDAARHLATLLSLNLEPR
ncbi:hypothetical protein OPKNFCMD_4034 [Methylobacterium crusticola]|uniref:DNA primase n=1 Tax=Methylobacterium crusticola TaxID=1697972 RepID=A0ABQ4R2U4_9HYPH|nr:hypothetical protein [Methylobacterium crusticola]GJD51280.1 hypothetical protein OPKNFCMD_4034 [Methylobacterium crusticola]